jgi:hypothetical protein
MSPTSLLDIILELKMKKRITTPKDLQNKDQYSSFLDSERYTI